MCQAHGKAGTVLWTNATSDHRLTFCETVAERNKTTVKLWKQLQRQTTATEKNETYYENP